MVNRRNTPRHTSTANLRNPSLPPPVAPPQVDTLGIEFRNQEHLNNFIRLSSRRIKPTRFYDVEASRLLMVDGDVAQLFNQVGWSSWLNLHSLTYRNLTLEFLSTFSVTRSEGSSNPRRVSFQLLGQHYDRPIGFFNNCFGWPKGGTIGPRSPLANDYSPVHFWQRLTGRLDYNPARSKGSCIVSPCFRITQRFLTGTIFARGDSQGVVSAGVLYFMWHMSEGDERINPGAWLIDHLEDVSVAKKGDIAIGGMISIIAATLGVDFADMQAVTGDTRLNFRSFTSMV